MAYSFTGENAILWPRFLGLSGWVNTPQTSCPSSTSRRSDATAKSGVPINKISTTDLFEAEGLYVHGASKIETEDGKNVLDIIRNGRVNFVINTMSNKKNTSADGFLIRRVSAENNISCMTSLDTANALVKVLESLSFSMVSMNEMGK